MEHLHTNNGWPRFRNCLNEPRNHFTQHIWPTLKTLARIIVKHGLDAQ